MRQDTMKNLRNIGIIAHIDAGKTTLSERILFYTRKIHRMGEVHDGTATMDFMPEEQERGITIAAAASTCHWKDWTLNLIDTPGHVDFTIEVERSLRVLDGAVGVFCAVGGVEPQSETVWRQSESFGVPKIAFVNKMDRVGANFAAVLDALHARLGANPAPVTVPLGEGPDFYAVADVIAMKKLVFDEDSQGQNMEVLPLEESEKEEALLWRDKLLETLGENDDAFMELYLEERFSEDDIHAALKRSTLARKVTPVLAGSALKNAGVQPLLDAVGRYLPSPLDVPAPHGTTVDGKEEKVLDVSPDAPFCGLVFKVLMEGGRKTALVRVYSGRLKDGDVVRNTALNKEERVSRMFRMDADQQEQLAEASSGDIIAVLGLRSARTGDTMAAPGLDILLENLEEVKPVISMALEPRNADEGKTLDEALAPLLRGRSHARRDAGRRLGRPHHFGHGRTASRRGDGAHAPRIRHQPARRTAAGGGARNRARRRRGPRPVRSRTRHGASHRRSRAHHVPGRTRQGQFSLTCRERRASRRPEGRHSQDSRR